MFTRHYPYWPPGVPKGLSLPRTSLYYNLEVSARRYPDKTAIAYYGSSLSYAVLEQEVTALAGFLQQHPLVARFATAPPEQGGGGVTVVELKD